MLDWHAMRIGFVTQLLWDRYGYFWRRLFEDAGAEILFPEPEATKRFRDDRRVAGVSGASFRLAVAQALALAEADVIVAPSLNAGSESSRGGGQDPWVADFPGALGTLGGLPSVLGVPAWLSPEFEPLAVRSLNEVVHDGGRVKRVWDRHRAGLRHEPLPEPSWRAAAGRRLVGVLAQPWLMNAELASRVAPADSAVVGLHQIDPFRLREEGERIDPRMIPTDQEVMGAARLFSRRGTIREVHMVVDESSGSDLWLRERLARLLTKPLVVHSLAAAPPQARTGEPEGADESS
jgi:hypothetical protein